MSDKSFKINQPEGEDLEPHQIFLDKLAQKSEVPGNKNRLELPFKSKRIISLVIFCILVLTLLFGKTLYLQTIQGNTYRQKAQQNAFAMQSMKIQRGVIYDNENQQLVWNKPNYKLVLEKSKFQQLNSHRQEKILKEVSEICPSSLTALKQKVNQEKKEITLNEKRFDYPTIVSLETKLKEWSGIHLKKDSYRSYYQGKAFAPLLGYTSRINLEGRSGLEKEYSQVLSPQGGKIRVVRNAAGEVVDQKLITQPQPGYSLQLHLDKEFQTKIYETTRQRMKELGVEEANVVALDPNDGGVIALVSLPSYNNNLFSQALSPEKIEQMKQNPEFSLYNQVISGWGYSTGSVIKPLIALAALEENIISPNKVIFAPEKICVTNKYAQQEECFRDWKFHGDSDIRRAIAESVNTFFYIIGGGYENMEGLGAEKIKQWLQKFNWGAKTGIDLPNEGKGLLPNLEENWRLGDTYHFSIGQGPFAVTPLQVAAAFVGIANKGIIYQSQVVDKIIQQHHSEQTVVQDITPKVLNSGFASAKNLQVVREGMRQSVSSMHGSAHNLNDLPVKIAAKTGTAQTEKENYFHSWIVTFAPYENPEIVLVVMLKKVPEKLVAAKYLAQDLLDWYFSHDYDKIQDK